MDLGNGPAVATAGTRAPRRRASFTGVLGEILITVGVIALLFFVWQLWIGDAIQGAQNNAAGKELSQSWSQETPKPLPTQTDAPAPSPSDIPIPVPAEPTDGTDFGVLHIPRFGDDYAVTMAGGVTRTNTLDKGKIGHYPDTAMPGDPGNFALAAHRMTVGAPFGRLGELQIGDAIVVETKEGWYTYRYRTLEYVTPQQVDVLFPVPQVSRDADGMGYITLTSCSPKWSMAERIIAYGVFESFTPRDAGAPASLTSVTGA